MKPPLKGPDVVLLTAILVFLVALAAFAYVGSFTRYMADDYCLSANVQRLGFVKAQTSLYLTWTGRYTYTFLISVLELFGPASVPLGILAGLICWLTAAIWSIYRIGRLAQWPRSLLISVLLGAMIVFAMLNGADNIVQSVYWQGGLVNYVVPLILLTSNAGLVCYAIRKSPGYAKRFMLAVLSGSLTLVAGGLTEAYGVLQVCALLAALLLFYKYSSNSVRRVALPILIAAFAASLVALVVVAWAPGNAVRLSYFPPPPNIFKLLGLSAYYTCGFIVNQFINAPLNALALLLAPFVIAGWCRSPASSFAPHLDRPRSKVLLLLVPVIGFLLILVCFMTGVYAISAPLPERARFIPQFVLVVTMMCWGFLLWKSVEAKTQFLSRAILTLALGLMLLAPLLSIWRALKLVSGARAGAAMWEQMDRDLRAAKAQGLLEVTVPAVDDVETRLGARRTELHIEREPNHWKNRCVASYYGVKSVTAR